MIDVTQILSSVAPYVITGACSLFVRAVGKLNSTIQENSRQTANLTSKIEMVAAEGAAFQRSVMTQFEELKTKSRTLEAELSFMGERHQDILDEFTALWGLARIKGWRELPERPNIRKRKDLSS